MNELILIRHGESHYNAMLTDNLDSQLTDKGREQAKRTGKFLREHFGHIQDFVGLTSPYLRCLQTSEIIQQELGIEFLVTSGPREIMVSYDTTVKVPNRSVDFPHLEWASPIYSEPRIDDSWIFNQETADEFLKRIALFMHSGLPEKTLVVSHGTPVCSMYDIKLGMKKPPDLHTYVGNASVTYIRDGEGIWFGKNIHAEKEKRENI